MSKIGYAVFGSPKGIAVISNGIFKDLNLDKLKVKNGICYDIKGFFEKNQVSSRL